ncbi:hypothetical protein MTR_1g052230 [Medicago truncatula]|uniref:Uncharacterized protein n=1 Tax=Medicago truncatula TaxID=3880 RepID=A0A072VJD9_MEDTR|nr:hypothetical protein MTR_1g052230 [Medicago truncatula]
MDHLQVTHTKGNISKQKGYKPSTIGMSMQWTQPYIYQHTTSSTTTTTWTTTTATQQCIYEYELLINMVNYDTTTLDNEIQQLPKESIKQCVRLSTQNSKMASATGHFRQAKYTA